MSFSKIFAVVALMIIVGVFAINTLSRSTEKPRAIENEVVEVKIADELVKSEEVALVVEEVQQVSEPILAPLSDDSCLPQDVDLLKQIFKPSEPLHPLVETVTYTSRVSWLTGRPAYLGDYASHYQTSKHFIARSLHGPARYLLDTVSKGDKFNVFRSDKKIEFHLVLDLSRLKLWLYCYDINDDQRILLKNYPVSAGRLDSKSASGSLTPLGTFALGKEIAVYKEGMMGTFRNEAKEMVTIFGSRWIPLGKEIANCTSSSRGLGIQGTPWISSNEGLIEDRDCIGKYESNGCIRLLTEDMEELFAVVVSKPAFIHIVRDFTEAALPGKENI